MTTIARLLGGGYSTSERKMLRIFEFEKSLANVRWSLCFYDLSCRVILVMTCSNANGNGNKKFTFRRTFELASIKNTITLSVCPSKILHKYCFYSLLGLTTVPRDTGNSAYANFWRDKD